MSSKKVSKPFEENFQELNSISLSVQDQEEMRRWLHNKVRRPKFFTRFYRSIVPATATIAVLTVAFLMYSSETSLKNALSLQGEESASTLKTGSSDLSDEELALIEQKEQETISKMENLFNLSLENYHPAYNLPGTTAFRELQDILGATDNLPNLFVKAPIQDTRKSPAYLFWEDERGAYLYTIEYSDSNWNVRTITHINESGIKEVAEVKIDFKSIDQLFEEYVANTWAHDVYQATSMSGNHSMEMQLGENESVTLNIQDKKIQINSFDKKFELELDDQPYINRLVGSKESSLGFLEILGGDQEISTYVMNHQTNEISKLEDQASTPVYDTFHKLFYVVAGEAGQEYVTIFEDGQVQPSISSEYQNIVSIIPSGDGKYLDYLVETSETHSYKLMRYTLETNKETELVKLNMHELKYMVHNYLNQPLSEINNRLIHKLY
ncbi:hypothetical protein [Bacillus sp. AK128]